MSAARTFKFRLFVAGDAQNSVLAIANLKAICDAHTHDRYEIEVVDVLREPLRALHDGIFLTPTLMKVTPLPECKVVGTLSQTQIVVQALGLATGPP